MSGRTIKIHLIEGAPSGVMTAEIIASWTGKVILAPRTKLPELAKRLEMSRAGVYFLIGDDPDDLAREQVYIGESEDVFKRLKGHSKVEAKDFWKNTIIVISKDEHLTKSLVRYLESRLIQTVRQAGRATLTNGTAPECPKLPDSDVDDMEYFLHQIQMLLPVLGFSFIMPAPVIEFPATMPQGDQQFTPVPISDPQAPIVDSPFFEMKVNGAYAKAKEVANEFVVLTGSTVRSETSSAFQRGYAQLRARLHREGKLVESEQEGLWKFAENVPFNSSTAAACVVAGTSRSGPASWQVEGTNQNYGKWQQAKIETQIPEGSEVFDDDEDLGSDDETGESAMRPLEIPVPHKEQMVLGLAWEGGGIDIFRRRDGDGWIYWSSGSRMALDENDEDHTEFWTSNETTNPKEVLPSNLCHLVPTSVQPEFVEVLRPVFEEFSAAMSPEDLPHQDADNRARWGRVLGVNL